MKTLYPSIEPFRTHTLQHGIHGIHVEECGNPGGLPVLFFHGGPGSGCKPYHRSFFNADKYHIIIFDQRGAGRSLPSGSIEENTTHDLLRDIELIRVTLGIDKWLLFGGSWGSTLALLYAQAHPERVAGMILRGTFLARNQDLEWFAGTDTGITCVYPDLFEQLFSGIEHTSCFDLIIRLYRMVCSPHNAEIEQAARAWYIWGSQIILGAGHDPASVDLASELESVIHQSRLELHYAANRYFIEENQILNHCASIQDIPAILIHGRHDMTCPLASSYALHRTLNHSRLLILPDAGHTSSGPGMINALVEATDTMITEAQWSI